MCFYCIFPLHGFSSKSLIEIIIIHVGFNVYFQVYNFKRVCKKGSIKTTNPWTSLFNTYQVFIHSGMSMSYDTFENNENL